jgi:hypothetical protein
MALSLASYFVVERPVRSGALPRRLGPRLSIWTWPVAVTLTVALLMVATRPPDLAAAPEVTTSSSSSVASDGTRVRLMVFGDSVAHSLAGGDVLAFPNVAPWTQDQATLPGLWSVARPGCSFLPGLVVPKKGADSADLSGFCGDWRADLDAALTAHDSSHLMVLLSNDMLDRSVDGRSVPFGSAEYVTLLDALLDEIAGIATAHAVQLVLVAPAPLEGEFAVADDHAAAMFGLLTDASRRLDAIVVSLSDAPTTARYDGTHYARADAVTVMEWLTTQV